MLPGRISAPASRRIYTGVCFAKQISDTSGRTFTIVTFPSLVSTQWSTVSPSSSTASMSAPLSRRTYNSEFLQECFSRAPGRTFSTSTLPSITARIRGVLPSASAASISAPLLSRYCERNHFNETFYSRDALPSFPHENLSPHSGVAYFRLRPPLRCLLLYPAEPVHERLFTTKPCHTDTIYFHSF